MKKQLTARELKERKKSKNQFKIVSIFTVLFICVIIYTGNQINATTTVEKQQEAVTMAKTFKDQGYSASDSSKMLKKLFKNIEFTPVENDSEYVPDKLNIHLNTPDDKTISIETIVFEK